MAAPTIRPYRAEDLDPVVDLWYGSWHAAFPDLTHFEPKAEWRRRLAEEIAVEDRIFVAEVDGQLAGVLSVTTREGEGYVREIFVAPERQRQGVGTALMALAKQLYPDGLSLHTLQRNAPASAFYEKHGFVVASRGIGRVGLPNARYRWRPR